MVCAVSSVVLLIQTLACLAVGDGKMRRTAAWYGSASLSCAPASGEAGGMPRSSAIADTRPCRGGFRPVSRSSRDPGGSSAGLRAACVRCRPERSHGIKSKSVVAQAVSSTQLVSGSAAHPAAGKTVRSMAVMGVSRKRFAEATGGSV